ncbi:restriction endonuclease S subunit [Acetobacter estunensis NRIC 0472]|uniref:Restriction endonuclease subunit S n=1 Tax=Acetobacter estunensis TaxID=104097 RepID=A0A967EIE1_9PROT|nr:restriction endonuclease subunit S [Acetobacter estunensis]NHO55312.1 restriction endonuclease subunit S [Acetobacter estunensis]GBQ25025.1 restriction endonuclease S subunit [Acetobacter estunensis NRIC 0472]
MLPEGWRKKSFGDVVYIANGLVDPREASFKNTKHIGPENVISDTGRIVNERTCGDLKLISGKYEFDKHSIVYSKIRPNLNKVCTPSYSGVCSADMYVLHPRKGIDKNFLFFSILGDTFKTRAISMSMRTGMPKINREDLSSIPILLPPLPEQKKIAAILSTWDRAIEGTEKLLANSQQQKKALMQQLLTGKKRLPGFTGEWKVRKFQDLFQERVETERTDLPLLSVTANDGVIFQEDSGRKDISKEDKSKYKRIYVDDIGYNTMRMWQGRSCLSDKEGIVSPAYTIVFAKKDICTRFASYLFKFPPMIHVFYRHSQGLVSDTWNLKFKHFKEISWKLPPLPEQKAIAAVLSTADEEITAIESDLSRLRQEKKALMQQLLTGKRRVKVD